jgi:hypothetical protein
MEAATHESSASERAFEEAESAGRLRVLLDLSLLLKTRGGNARAWIGQANWQSLLLDLMVMPHGALAALRTADGGPLAEAGGEGDDEGAPLLYALLSEEATAHPYADTSSASAGSGGAHSVGRGSGARAQRSGGAGASAETTASAVAAIASDTLASLLCYALEIDQGWRVWTSTIAAIADR